jgi:hypothetical protein
MNNDAAGENLKQLVGKPEGNRFSSDQCFGNQATQGREVIRVNGLAICRQWRGWNALPRPTHCEGLMKSGVLYFKPLLPTPICKTPEKVAGSMIMSFGNPNAVKLLLGGMGSGARWQ